MSTEEKKKKPLSEMTLEELWELFPILLSPHQSCWKEWYREEESALLSVLKGTGCRISHIGSTAIEGIMAKPIVDILVELPKKASMEAVKELLESSGYLCMSEGENRMSFNKGYTENGFAEKVFHLHLRYWGDHDELYFRDYLREHAAWAKEYEKLKISLWKKYEHNRDAYTEAKSSFVLNCTKRAKERKQNCDAGEKF